MAKARARRTDPATSHGAAGSLPPKAIKYLHRIILRVLIDRRESGANWMEVCRLLDGVMRQDMRQSLSPRWTEMRDAGLIEFRYHLVPAKPRKGQQTVMVTERVRRPGWSHRPQDVHFITAHGEAMLRLWSGPLQPDEGALAEVLNFAGPQS